MYGSLHLWHTNITPTKNLTSYKSKSWRLGDLPLHNTVFGVSDTICNNSVNSLDSISEKINDLLPNRLSTGETFPLAMFLLMRREWKLKGKEKKYIDLFYD